MQSKATTVKAYLAELPAERRQAIQAVRETILANLDSEYEEGMQYGMIGYYVPHRVYAAGYHCDPKQPLPFAALASQKNYMSLYMMGIYGENNPNLVQFQKEWAKTGKKLNMGKACIRFQKLEDLPLQVIGAAIARLPARTYIALYEAARRETEARPTKGKPKSAGVKKAARKK